MHRIVWMLFAVAIIVGAATIAATLDRLPEVVATHFGRDGLANGWMSQGAYAITMLAVTIGAPLAVAVGTTWLPRVSPSMLKLDRCRRWANPAARPGLIAATSMLGGVIGTTLAVFLGAIHLLVVDANASSPARMDQPAFVGLMLSFAAVTIVACGIHAIRTRRA